MFLEKRQKRKKKGEDCSLPLRAEKLHNEYFYTVQQKKTRTSAFFKALNLLFMILFFRKTENEEIGNRNRTLKH